MGPKVHKGGRSNSSNPLTLSGAYTRYEGTSNTPTLFVIVDCIGSATGIGPDPIPTTTTHPRTHARNTRTLAVLHTHTTPINITRVFEVCFACLSDRDRKQRSPAVPLRLVRSRLEIESNQKGGRGEKGKGKGKGKGKQREREREKERGGKERWEKGEKGGLQYANSQLLAWQPDLLLLVQDFARRCHQLLILTLIFDVGLHLFRPWGPCFPRGAR